MNPRRVIPKDAIPSIDDPVFGSAYFGIGTDEVVVVDSEPARAYPIQILNYHEIVNDRVADEPVAVTWCPLCASAVVYDRQIDGRVLTFGVSGKLVDDDLVMYDRETGSEWKQSRGECISGQFEGATLTVRSAGIVPYDRFVEEHPDGMVLQRPDLPSEAASDSDEPAAVDYGEDPYREYVDGEGFGLAAHHGSEGRSWDRTDIDPKTVVLGLERDGEAVGYPRSQLLDEGDVVTDTVGETPVVVTATDAGLHAFENPGYEFSFGGDGELEADGTRWDPVTGASEDGRSLSRLPARRLFAFTWQDDHGPDSFFALE